MWYLGTETLVKGLNNLGVHRATSWDALKGRAIENRMASTGPSAVGR